MLRPLDIAISAASVAVLLGAYAGTAANGFLIALAVLPFAQIVLTITGRVVVPAIRESRHNGPRASASG